MNSNRVVDLCGSREGERPRWDKSYPGFRRQATGVNQENERLYKKTGNIKQMTLMLVIPERFSWRGDESTYKTSELVRPFDQVGHKKCWRKQQASHGSHVAVVLMSGDVVKGGVEMKDNDLS